MGNFEFQIKFSSSEELSIGMEQRLRSVSEVPREDFEKAISSIKELPSEIAKSLGIAPSYIKASPTEIENQLFAQNLQSSSEISCYVSETNDGRFITYFLRRLSSSSNDLIGTHRFNFEGDIREGKELNVLSEVATVTYTGKDPNITWLIKEADGSVKSYSSKLIEKRVFEIPFDDLDTDFESIIWAGSHGTKSHGH